MSSVNSMEQFQDYFGLEAAETGTSLVFVRSLDIANRYDVLRGRVSTLLDRSAPSSSTSTFQTRSVDDGPCSSRTCSNALAPSSRRTLLVCQCSCLAGG